VHEINLSLQWLFAVIALVPVVLLGVIVVKDRLQQRRRGLLSGSERAVEQGIAHQPIRFEADSTSRDEILIEIHIDPTQWECQWTQDQAEGRPTQSSADAVVTLSVVRHICKSRSQYQMASVQEI
jgi:hypothetical protein